MKNFVKISVTLSEYGLQKLLNDRNIKFKQCDRLSSYQLLTINDVYDSYLNFT